MDWVYVIKLYVLYYQIVAFAVFLDQATALKAKEQLNVKTFQSFFCNDLCNIFYFIFALQLINKWLDENAYVDKVNFFIIFKMLQLYFLQGLKFDPHTGAVLHIELARANSRTKRFRSGSCICFINRCLKAL